MADKSGGDAVRVPSVHTKTARHAAVVLLIAVGLGLIGLASGLWLSDGSPPNATTIKRTATRPHPKSTQSTTSKARCKCAGKRKTVVKTTERKKGGGPSKRSETLSLALLGLGGLFVLCGVFFGRIQEVTLPGGGSLKLTEETQAQIASKVVDVANNDPGLTADAATIGRLYEKTLESLTATHRPAMVAETEEGFYVVGAPVLSEIPDEKVEQAAEVAAEELKD